MLKFSVALNVVLVLAVGYFLFAQADTKTAPAPVKGTSKDTCASVCLDYHLNPPYTLLNGQLLRLMAGNYRATNVRPVSNSHNNKLVSDANSVWFGLEDLKRFIWEIESKVCSNNCPNRPALQLGVRIYYARYPGTGQYDTTKEKYFEDLRDDYENMHTVFMVPTYDLPGVSDKHIDFYINHPYTNCYPDSIRSEGSIGSVAALTVTGKNHGTLCPPVCGGSAFR